MARTFRELMAEISPPWLLTVSGRPFMEAIGEVKDGMLWRMFEAARLRFPTYGTADSLAAIGAERGIPRSVGESLASYAGRVRGAWASWVYAGTALGLLRALYDSGYTNVSLAIFNGRRYTLDGDRELVETVLDEGSWKFGTLDDAFWSRFIVLFPEPLLARWVADGVPGSSSDEANLIRGLVRRWKPAHMTCSAIIIATCEETFGYYPEGGTWGDAGADLGDSTAWTSWTP